MRHGRKSATRRFDGHKAAVAVDTDSQLITAVDVLAGNAPDNHDALALVERSEAATGCAVEETYGDCAYGDGATRQAFADAGRVLHAKVAVLPNHGGFPKTAFRIDLEAPPGPACTCPGGHTTTTTYPAGRGRRLFIFPAAICAACPLRAQCLTEPNGRTGVSGVARPRRTGRTILLHPQEALLQAARAFQRSPAFAAVRRPPSAVRRRRQAAEHRLARLVQLGIRQARDVGRTKTLFQLLLAATVANLALLATADNPTGPTTPTGPTALMAACATIVLLTLTLAAGAIWARLHAATPNLRRARRLATPPLALSLQMAGFRPDF